MRYTIHPGEWMCKVPELTDWFRPGTRRRTFAILNQLQERHLIAYVMTGRGDMIHYRICNWARSNRILDYNAPCHKTFGFFFVPMDVANYLIGSGKCSEMDALLDLWMNTVYNDIHVKGSEMCPLVYIRNGSGNPLITYAQLAERWGVSKATVCRYLKDLADADCISCVSFSGKHGTVITLRGYMSTMFNLSDVMLDKDEIAMAIGMKVKVDDEEIFVSEEKESVSESGLCVSKSATDRVVQKVANFLTAQGNSCSFCDRFSRILLELSGCKEHIESITIGERYALEFRCGGKALYRFELSMKPYEEKALGK